MRNAHQITLRVKLIYFVAIAIIGILLCSVNSGWLRRRDSQPEKMDATYQQLRHVLGAIQLAAMEQHQTNRGLRMNALIQQVMDQRGAEFLKSEIDLRMSLQIHSDVIKWMTKSSNNQEIAVYSSIQFVDNVRRVTNYVAIDFNGKRMDLVDKPAWKPFTFGP